jgi:hypothetical protein
MAITRQFIDWQQPILPAAAEFLADRYASGGALDCRDAIVVVPGSRAGRLLRELLIQIADERKLTFTPPRVVTLGDLPEQLYQSTRPHANDLVQRLAWVEALRSMGRRRVASFVAHPPPADQLLGWIDLAELLGGLHRELAAEVLDFGNLVGHVGTKGEGFDETARWKFLREVQRKYLDVLRELNLWDRQTARLFAIQHAECRTDSDIVLVATVDMNRSMRRMLDQVAGRVTALVHAPQALADRFDALGCVVPSAWEAAVIAIGDNQIRIADQPGDQAAEVARALAELDGKFRADEISIGVPEEALVPQVQRQLDQCGVRNRYVVGRRLKQTAPYRLLEAVAKFVSSERFDAFATLVRHPDVGDWLARCGITAGWLSKLDDYYQRHLPGRLGQWLGKRKSHAAVREVFEMVERTCAPLREGAKPLADWAAAIVGVLRDFYNDVELDGHDAGQHATLTALEHISNAAAELARTPARFAAPISAPHAIELLLGLLGEATAPAQPDDEAIELLGWLELATDPAPALIVTSLNEGVVPTSMNADVFLPNKLRQRLDLVDNRRRYARDAYALSVLAASRQRLTLIAGRRDVEGNPLLPSRLLFAAPRDGVVRRARDFFKDGASERKRPLVIGQAPALAAESQFVVRRPDPLAEPVSRMRVTSFGNYLACPYRFYLKHVLKLESVDDTADELDAAGFGSLIHEVLRQFGESDERESTNADAIAKFLVEKLDGYMKRQFGKRRLAAIKVQVRGARARLEAFARWQAEWRKRGRRIVRTESEKGSDQFELDLDGGRSMTVSGRIDRIDCDENTGEWFVLDYKTSDRAKTPNEVHRKRGEWVDLQLPLYRYLARATGIDGPIHVGYVSLPKDTDRVTAHLANWSDGEFEEADALAKSIARDVLDEKFWPPTYPPPHFSSEFAPLCQDDVFARRFESSAPPTGQGGAA